MSTILPSPDPHIATTIQWQNSIRASLMAKQAEQAAYKEIIDQYRRLAQTARELQIRNRTLLKGGTGPSTGPQGNAPLLAHLDAQVSALRNELSTVYRTQAASQNKQLALSDALRDRDEEVRGLREEVRELREAKEAGKRREKDWEDRWKARTKDMEVLNDELLSLNLELTSVTQRNNALQTDNASLLQRWIDKMNLTAEEMNEEFEKETQTPVANERTASEGAKGDFRKSGKAT